MRKSISILMALVMMATVLLPFGAFAADKYSITTTGCSATLNGSAPYYTASEAEAGQTVYLILGSGQAPASGKYVEFTSDDVTIVNKSFTMPAKNVSVTATQKDKQDYTFDLTSGSCVVTPVMLAELMKFSYDFNSDGQEDIAFDTTQNKIIKTQAAIDAGIEEGTKNVGDYYSMFKKLTFIFKTEEPQPETYTVTWQYDNGSPIQISSGIHSGETVHCEKTPTKASTMEYDYKFTGWSPAEGVITGNTVYTAQFKAIVRKRNIVFKNWNGTVLQSSTILATESPQYYGATPTRAKDSKYRYTFAGWNYQVNSYTGDAVYTARYNAKGIPISLSFKKKTYKAKTKTKKYTATLKIDGKAAKNKKITMKVNKKTFTAKTNAKGQATFKVTNLKKKGSYKATISYKGAPKNISQKVTIKVSK